MIKGSRKCFVCKKFTPEPIWVALPQCKGKDYIKYFCHSCLVHLQTRIFNLTKKNYGVKDD